MAKRTAIIPGAAWREVVEGLPEVTFLLDHLVPNHATTVLHGPPGAGKSALLWGIGNAVSAGATFLGFKTRETRTLLISIDMNVFELNTRWGTNFTPNFDLVAPNKFDLTDPAFRKSELWDTVGRYVEDEGVGLILIDAIGGTHAGKSAMDDDVATAVDAALSVWFPKSAILMLAHDRKVKFSDKGQAAGRGEEDILGSQMWRSNCTSQLHMYAAGANVSVLRHEKCQVGPKWSDPIRVCVDEHGSIQLWGKAQAEECARKYRDAVNLLGVGELRTTERNEAVAKYYHVDVRTVRRWCTKVRDEEGCD